MAAKAFGGHRPPLQVQFIKRAPIRLARFRNFLFGFRLLVWRGANSPALTIATRIRGQVQEDVLPHKRRQIDRLRPGEFGVEGELRHANRVYEALQTRDAGQLDRLGEGAIRPERAFRDPEIE